MKRLELLVQGQDEGEGRRWDTGAKQTPTQCRETHGEEEER